MSNDKKKINLKAINNDDVAFIAEKLLQSFDGMNIEDSPSVIYAVSVTLAQLVKNVREMTESDSVDGVERIVLYTLSLTDEATGNNFTKYIDQDNIKL